MNVQCDPGRKWWSQDLCPTRLSPESTLYLDTVYCLAGIKPGQCNNHLVKNTGPRAPPHAKSDWYIWDGSRDSEFHMSSLGDSDG